MLNKSIPVWFASLLMISQGHAQEQEPFPDILSLSQALEMIDPDHPRMLRTRARELGNQADRESVLSDMALDVSLEAELRQVDKQLSPGRNYVDDSRVRLIVDKPLTDFGYSKQRMLGVEAGLSAARESQRITMTALRSEVIRAYLDVILSDYEFIAADEEMSVAFLTFQDEQENMDRFGDAALVDVVGLEAIYLEKLAERRAANQRQRTSRQRLALALNRPEVVPDLLTEPDVSRYEREVPEFDDLLGRVMENSVELKVARLDLESAKSSLEASGLSRRPILGVRLEATEYAEVFGGSRDEIRGSLYLDLPIYNSVVQGASPEQAARLADSEARLAELEHVLRVRILSLVEELQTLEIRINAARAALFHRELELDRVRLEYEMEVRARIGTANAKVARAHYNQLRAEYERVMIWEQIDALSGSTPIAH